MLLRRRHSSVMGCMLRPVCPLELNGKLPFCQMMV